jgi:hypothetical protein
LSRCAVTTLGYNTVLLGSDNLGSFVMSALVACSLRDSQSCTEGQLYDVDPCAVPDHPMCQTGSTPSGVTYTVATKGANGGGSASAAAWPSAAAAAVLLLPLLA